MFNFTFDNIIYTNLKRIIISTSLFIVFFIGSCTNSNTQNEKPLAVKGVIDLKNWDFSKNESLILNGEWRFWWNEFIDINKLKTSEQETLKSSSFIKVGTSWKDQFYNNKKIESGKGYGTYFLKILLPDSFEQNSYAISFERSIGAITVQILEDPRLNLQIGHIGKNEKEEKPWQQYRFKSINLANLKKSEINLVIHTSNHYMCEVNFTGGLVFPPKMGIESEIINEYYKHNFIILFTVSLLAILFLLHLFLYYYQKNDKSYLFFSLFVCSVMLYTVFGFNIFHPFLDSEIHKSYFLWRIKLEYFCATILSPMFFMLYIEHLIPGLLFKKINKIFIIAFCILCIPFIFLSAYNYSLLIQVYQIYALLLSTYIFYILIKNINKQNKHHKEIVGVIAYISIIIFCIVNDTLRVYQVLNTPLISQYGVILFFIGQALLIARKNAEAFYESEYLKENLKIEVKKQTIALETQAQNANDARNEAEKIRKQVQKANIKLKELDNQKTHFFQSVSHELRTPLTLILNSLEEERNRHETSKNIELAERNARRLLRLVNQLLDFQKSIAGKREFRIEKIDLIKFINSSIGYFETACRNKEIKFNVTLNRKNLEYKNNENSIIIESEFDALEKIIFNLLSNALKYTEKKGYINLNITANDSYAVIEVEDNGLGISKEDQDKLFKVFSQVNDPITRDNIGTGLGLALVKELSESMSGEVGVDSAPGKGSKFWVTLPCIQKNINDEVRKSYSVKEWHFEDTKQLETSDIEIIKSEFNGDQQLIMVVDDLLDMRNLIGATLAKEKSYTIIKVKDAIKGLEIAKEKKPDLIVTDWMMPIKTGPEMISELKSIEELSSIPIILLTAKSDEESRAKGVKSGADAYLGKPFDEMELISMVKNLLLLKNKERKLENTLNELETAHEELKKTQGKMVSQARLALLGQMISGVSHEIANPFNAILGSTNNLKGFVERLLKKISILDAKSEDENEISKLKSKIDLSLELLSHGNIRIKYVLDNLRQYLRGKNVPVEEFDIANGIDSCISLLRERINNQNIQIIKDYNTLPKIQCKTGEINQVFMNLFINSLDEMPSEGKLEIKGKHIENFIEITIKDNGPGIPQKHKDSIFKAFFSKKESSKGTGLGLYISREIITKHFGELKLIESEKGAAFLIRLPITSKKLLE